jgi:hypothetical protein
VVVPLEDKARSVGQLTILQAMALGKPVIATRTVGTIDYVCHGVTGILVPPHDSASIRHWIRRLWSDPSMRTALGEQARRVAEHYSQTRFLEVVRKLASLLARGCAPAPEDMGVFGMRPVDLAAMLAKEESPFLPSSLLSASLRNSFPGEPR